MCSLLSLEPPAIINKPPSQVTVKEGSIFRFCCEATGSPPPKIQWSRAGQFSDSTLASQENGCLEFDTVRYNSGGDYICRATNNYGLAETTITVIASFTGIFLYIYSRFVISKKYKTNCYCVTYLKWKQN